MCRLGESLTWLIFTPSAMVSIEAFLGAAHAWGRDSARGARSMSPMSNPWKRCADILLMGKLYE